VHPSWLRAALAASLTTFSLVACGGSGDNPRDRIKPTYDKSSGRLTQLEYDANHDGRIDTWMDMDGTRPLRSRIDQNGDGTIDRWEEYDATGALVRVGFSRRGDGKPDAWLRTTDDHGLQCLEISSSGDEHKIDRWEYYEGGGPAGKPGTLMRAEEDTVGDGRPHKWESYRAGVLETVAFDEDGDGVPDRRLTYQNAALVLIETRREPDGHFAIRTAVK
jgi:hypothetical protein